MPRPDDRNSPLIALLGPPLSGKLTLMYSLSLATGACSEFDHSNFSVEFIEARGLPQKSVVCELELPTRNGRQLFKLQTFSGCVF